MQKAKFLGAVGAILMFGGTALAQTVIEFTPEQERTIYTTITRERVRVAPPPPDFRLSVGVEIPAAVELYPVPSAIEIPTVRRYRYTLIDDQVVLVDPGTRRVVRVIRD